MQHNTINTYCYEETTTEKAIPWVFRIVCIVCIQEDRPLALVSSDLQLAIAEFHASPFNPYQMSDITGEIKEQKLLRAVPIETRWAEQGSGAVMVKAMSRLDVARDVRSQ